MGGKIYDYMIAGTALWCLAPNNAASLKHLIESHPQIFFSDVDNPSEIQNTLQQMISAKKSGTFSQYYFPTEAAKSYSRSQQYKKFLEFLSEPEC